MPSGYTSAVQRRPDELVGVLTADFQARSEPNFAWKSAVSAVLALPALRAAWPMSSVAYTNPQGRDLSVQGNHLTNNNTCTFGYDNLAPYVNFVAASSQSLSRADGGAGNWADISGTETYVVSTQRGLTIGGWFNPDILAGASNTVMSKWAGAGVRSYDLRLTAADVFAFLVSDDGTNSDTATSTVALSTGNWYFAVGRFDPGNFVEIFVNGTWVQQATARASAFDSTADFYIGCRSTVASYYDGQASLCFLCACELSDAQVFNLYQQTRVMYGVL